MPKIGEKCRIIVYRGEYGPLPFTDYKIYGPIFSKKEGRNIIVLFRSNKDRTSISYAKFLMSIKVGRRLLREEQVDHINNKKNDDRIENLQILTKRQNILKSKKPLITFELNCPQCGITFTRNKGMQPTDKNGRKSFCSRRCGVMYHHGWRNNEKVFG